MMDDFNTLPPSSALDDRVVDAVARFDASEGRALQRDAAASLAVLTARIGAEGQPFDLPARSWLRRPMAAPHRWWRGPAAIAAIALLATVLWHSGTRHRTASTQREYATGQDERATIQLGDGSRIVLGPGSRIHYAEPFGTDGRNVYLDGKAYFTVAAHQASPFVVYTATSATQVLGTAFVVKAMPYDSVVQVVVESGKVALRQRDSHLGSGTTLTRGELARLTPGGLMTVSHDVDVRAYSNWSRDHVELTNATVATVVRTIEERYDIQILLPSTVAPATEVSLGLDTETRDQAVQLLADVLDLTYTRTGRVVTLRPRH